MIKLKVETSKGLHESLVPESWQEVQLKHMVKLDFVVKSDLSSITNLLSVFTDIPIQEVENTSTDLWKPLTSILSFVYDPPKWDKLKVPDTLTIEGKEVQVPKKLNLQTFGQKLYAFQAMQKENQDAMVDVLCTYLQPALDGYTSIERAEIIRPQILSLPAIESVPLARFFFQKLVRFRKYGRIGFNLSLQIQLHRLHLLQQVVKG